MSEQYPTTGAGKGSQHREVDKQNYNFGYDRIFCEVVTGSIEQIKELYASGWSVEFRGPKSGLWMMATLPAWDSNILYRATRPPKIRPQLMEDMYNED